ncbi:MAG: choice-of-anchor D domain-containing protein, partial [Planctomycetes bacterium]|nr:choice-of-anchor D domain-containing protein [Planctomycetota bacterium]
QVGGQLAALGNTIAFNLHGGVTVASAASTGNSIQGNAIFSNGGLGIDLGNDGVTPNDPGDADSGPNNLQNAPQLAAASIAGSESTITGTLNSAANAQFTIEFFASAAADDSDYGEGELFLGAMTVTTGADGNVSFVGEFTGDFTNGRFITATATDADGSTSEFSQALRISTIVVVNTNDSGPGSLRQAILDANASPGLHTIVFNIPATDADFVDVDSALPGGDAEPDAYVITPLSALPALTDSTIIDARTQTSFGGDTNPFGPEIVLDGSGVAAGSGLAGLIVQASNSAVYGLNIQRFRREEIRISNVTNIVVAGNYVATDATGSIAAAGDGPSVTVTNSSKVTIGGSSSVDRNVVISSGTNGIAIDLLDSSENWVAGNRIGTNATGTMAIGHVYMGISIVRGQRNVIGTNGDGFNDETEGNLISGISTKAVSISAAFGDASGNVVAGNLIGVNADGSTAIPNGGVGVFISGGVSNTRIGTNGDGVSDFAERNVISANRLGGIVLKGSGNVVAGNLIGTDAAGMTAISNRSTGVSIDAGASDNRIGTNGDGLSDDAERNVIAGTTANSGVLISGIGTSGNVVAGNLIGTNAMATAAIGNTLAGVAIAQGASNNLVGTNGDGINDSVEGNVISGNADGVSITTGANNNIVAGNHIGTDPSGAIALGNLRGVSIRAAQNNTIGGTEPRAGNIIAFNRDTGVVITNTSAAGNAIRGNRIHHNDELGIDLGDNVTSNGVTPNDLGDPDAGPNNLQNFPELTSSTIVGSRLTMMGTLNSNPSARYTIEFFANRAADDSGYGEGEVFLGATTVMIGPDGYANFIQRFTGDFDDYRFITATATDAAGNTSEFSRALESVVDAANIIDDSDAVGFALSGEWATGGGPGIGRNGNVHLTFGEPWRTDTAAWTFNLSGPGRYRLSATWFTNADFPQLFTDAAPFTVIDTAAGVARGTALVNQKVFPNDFSDAGSDWEDLGVFDITGSSLVVQLTSTTDNATYVVADAIRIERVGDLPAAAEIQVTQDAVDVPDNTGAVSFGSADFNQPIQKTFTISNTGVQPLTLSSPVLVTGAVFSVVTQPAATTLEPGESTTFVVQMNSAAPGFHTAVVIFGNSDTDENPFDFTVSGTVLSTRIIDDGDPGFAADPALFTLGGWGYNAGAGRPGAESDTNYDYVYNINNPDVDEIATWTFNVTPGQYRVSTTWPFSFSAFDDAAPFTIFDGTVAGGIIRGGRNIDQKNTVPDDTFYPDGFGFPPGFGGLARWETIDVVNITGDTLTVLLQAVSTTEYVLADSILIDRLGDLPPGTGIVTFDRGGNSAGGDELAVGQASAAPETNNGRPEAYPTEDIINTAYWNEELDEVAVVLAEDRATDDESVAVELFAGSRGEEREAIELVLAEWL